MGKYTKLKETLPALVQEKSYQQKVDVEKAKIQDKSIGQLTALHVKHYDKKKAFEAKIKEENLQLEAIRQLIVTWMEGEGVSNYKTDEVTIFLVDEPYTSVKDEDVLRAWIKKHKHPELIGVKWQTLNAVVKEMLIGGKGMPDGIEVFIKTKVSRKKA